MAQQQISFEAIIEKLRTAAGTAAVEIAALQAALDQANETVDELSHRLTAADADAADLRMILTSESRNTKELAVETEPPKAPKTKS